MSSLNVHSYDEHINTTKSNNFDILEKDKYSEEKAKEFKKGLDIEKDTARKNQNKIVNHITNQLILTSYILNKGGEEHLKKKFLEIEKSYENGVKVVELTKGVNNGEDIMGIYQGETKEYIKNQKTAEQEIKIQTNFNKLVEICKNLGNRNSEHIFALISKDGSIHLVNDIDTGHYIIPKGLIENGDIGSLAKPVIVNEIIDGKEVASERMARGGEQFDLKESVYGDKLLEVGKNEPLIIKEQI